MSGALLTTCTKAKNFNAPLRDAKARLDGLPDRSPPDIRFECIIYANLALFISPVKTLGLFSCYCLLPVASRLLSIAYCLNHIACCPLPVAM